jgi:putative ABC transport system permease protein
MAGWIQDARHSARLLRRGSGVTAAAVATLALGIGATTAIFSVVNGVLLQPLPYKNVDRLQTLWQVEPLDPGQRKETSPANYIDSRERNQTFEEVVGVEPYAYDLVGEGEPEVFLASRVSRGFFEVLGVAAFMGRTFLPEEYRSGSVAVLSHGLWQRRFGGDPTILGRKLTFDEGVFTVVGVMPPEFRFPSRDREMWAPRVESERDLQNRGGSYIGVIGRLKPGATLAGAQADLERVAGELSREYPRTNKGVRVEIVPLAEQIVGEVRPALLVLLAAVGFVLLIGCANVAHLLLARGAERQREFAVRKALGASPGRLVRQVLTESLVLALAGAAAGLVVTAWGIEAIQAIEPGNIPRLEEVRIDWHVLVFSLGLSVLAAVAFGVAPAIQSAWLDPRRQLQEAPRTATAGAGRRRGRSFLVATEVSLALVLLIGAGLLIRSFARLLSVDPGFVPERVLALQVFAWTPYPKPEQRAASRLSRAASISTPVSSLRGGRRLRRERSRAPSSPSPPPTTIGPFRFRSAADDSSTSATPLPPRR